MGPKCWVFQVQEAPDEFAFPEKVHFPVVTIFQMVDPFGGLFPFVFRLLQVLLHHAPAIFPIISLNDENLEFFPGSFIVRGKAGMEKRIPQEVLGNEFLRILLLPILGEGRKDSGKSHLAKMLLRGLLEHGAYSIVFDLNDEYGKLGLRRDGSRVSLSSRVKVMRPGREMKFSLSSVGLRAITSLLIHSLDMPGTSLREFVKIWETLEGRGELTLASLEGAIHTWRCNEFVRDALFARYHTISSCGLFTDSPRERFDLLDFFSSSREGGSLVISFSDVSPLNRRMCVELVLSKLVELLEHRRIPPIFLFAEEAHLYLRETYWEDLITRMRHFGVFTVFVTNQPDAIDQRIYRQVDNVFLYTFSNDADLSMVSQASMADTDTVKALVRSLPPRVCLILGHAVSNLPVIVSVDPFDSPPTGATRRFFEDEQLILKETTSSKT